MGVWLRTSFHTVSNASWTHRQYPFEVVVLVALNAAKLKALGFWSKVTDSNPKAANLNLTLAVFTRLSHSKAPCNIAASTCGQVSG